ELLLAKSEVPMAQKIQVKSPYSQEIVGEFSPADFESVKNELRDLHQAQVAWKKVPLKARIDAVRSALNYFTQNKMAIATDITKQMGRPISQSPGEINGLLERANYLCDIAEEALSPMALPEKPGFERAIAREPLGVIFVISAWNYPLLVTVNSVVPALLAGNTVLLKHSSQTPAIGVHFEKAFNSMMGVSHLVKHIVVDHSTTGRIIEELDVQHVVFTGSVSGGQQILKHTAKKFMQPQLELGGKDAAYAAEDADIDAAAATVVDGAMFNSGQSCCGIERAYVHKDVYDQFIKRCIQVISEYKLGDPLDESTNLGPLVTEKAARAAEKQIQAAVQKGAKILAGGQVKKMGSGFFLEPTLMSDVKQNMELMQEENFAPILPVMPVSSMEEALKLVNDSQYGLTSAIFTKDLQKAKQFAEAAQTGTVFMNRCDYLDPALPWTGVKNSGCGSALSHLGFLSVTRAKALHFKLNKGG
ncbi:MAG: aldehyde dehydrogenase family protein, partial [Bdellovibrionales bacterium]|nr:aldehyde dehydrogenase family protein [Bdellovibrionales bacterium]